MAEMPRLKMMQGDQRGGGGGVRNGGKALAGLPESCIKELLLTDELLQLCCLCIDASQTTQHLRGDYLNCDHVPSLAEPDCSCQLPATCACLLLRLSLPVVLSSTKNALRDPYRKERELCSLSLKQPGSMQGLSRSLCTSAVDYHPLRDSPCNNASYLRGDR